MPRQTHAAFSRALAEYDARLEQAFLEAVQGITSQAQLRALDDAIERALRANDAGPVFEVLRLGAEFWAPLDRMIAETFTQGALWQGAQLQRPRNPAGLDLRIAFNHRNPRAEAWTRNRAANLVTEIAEDTRLGVRRVVQEGIEQGWGVQRIRRSLVGTQRGNQRTGGIIGLHSNDVDAVIRARSELSDPDNLRAYLRRMGGAAPSRRTVQSAINAERALTQAEIDRVTQSYSDRLLRVRGQRVARTEAHNAFTAGANEGVQQLVDSGRIPASAITMVWQSTVGSDRTRDSHRLMSGQTVNHGEAFVSPVTGARMMYPGDTSLGAPGSETIGCRCSALPVLDFVSLAR